MRTARARDQATTKRTEWVNTVLSPDVNAVHRGPGCTVQPTTAQQLLRSGSPGLSSHALRAVASAAPRHAWTPTASATATGVKSGAAALPHARCDPPAPDDECGRNGSVTSNSPPEPLAEAARDLLVICGALNVSSPRQHRHPRMRPSPGPSPPKSAGPTPQWRRHSNWPPWCSATPAVTGWTTSWARWWRLMLRRVARDLEREARRMETRHDGWQHAVGPGLPHSGAECVGGQASSLSPRQHMVNALVALMLRRPSPATSRRRPTGGANA